MIGVPECLETVSGGKRKTYSSRDDAERFLAGLRCDGLARFRLGEVTFES